MVLPLNKILNTGFIFQCRSLRWWYNLGVWFELLIQYMQMVTEAMMYIWLSGSICRMRRKQAIMIWKILTFMKQPEEDSYVAKPKFILVSLFEVYNFIFKLLITYYFSLRWSHFLFRKITVISLNSRLSVGFQNHWFLTMPMT